MLLSIVVNDLIKWEKNLEEPLIERVLWIDEHNTIAYAFDIYSSSGFPVPRKISDLIDDLEGGIAEKLNEDPYALLIREEDIGEKAKRARNESWALISSLVSSENEPSIFYRHLRGPMVKQVSLDNGVTPRTIYSYLRKYWQRGKRKNALLPDDHKKGGKGKERLVGAKKRGRPRKYSDEIGKGVNVDDETKKIFRIAIKRYYETEKENSLKDAYNLMIKDFYQEDYRFENGVKKPIIIPPEQIPTFTQFKYWYEKEKNVRRSITTRKGEKAYELGHRPLLSSSNSEVIGPGSRYQIDATVGDIYLVSRYNRSWIIGRPVIYFIIDVFSRMVTGLYIGLEGPSWLGSMMAFANAAMNKATLCKDYEIEITEEEWPCHHLPDALLADRGEMEGRLVETLINSLHVRIENTPPYRADWKGIVERYFKTVNTRVKPLLPGYIDIDFRKRGGKDYRLDAKLDIYQFTQIIIKCVLFYNNKWWMDKYSREDMMISDDVSPIPQELWKWGIANRSGRLRTFPEDIVKLNLMPVEKVTVTREGIRFKKWAYSCEKALKEMWFDIARNKGSWKLNASYDPRNMNYIYLRTEDGRGFEKCYLLESHSRFLNKSLDEINYLLEYEKMEKQKNAGNLVQSESDLTSDIEHIVKSAEEMTEMEKDSHTSKSSKVKGIRNHRKFEKTVNREKEAFELEKEEKGDTTKVVSRKKDIERDEEESKSPDNIEMLRKKQKEKFDEDK